MNGPRRRVGDTRRGGVSVFLTQWHVFLFSSYQGLLMGNDLGIICPYHLFLQHWNNESHHSEI